MNLAVAVFRLGLCRTFSIDFSNLGSPLEERCHHFPTFSSTSSTPFHQYLRIDRVVVATLLFKRQYSALLLAFLPSMLLASVGAYMVMHRRPLHAPPVLARPPSCSHYPSLQPVISRQTSARLSFSAFLNKLPSDSPKVDLSNNAS